MAFNPHSKLNYYSVKPGTAKRLIGQYHALKRTGYSTKIAHTTIAQMISPTRVFRRAEWGATKGRHLGLQAKTTLASYHKMAGTFGKQTARSFTRTATIGSGSLCPVRAHTRLGRAVRAFSRMCLTHRRGA